MIRVLALAHMVSENHVSSKLLYALCGNDHTYFDLLNTLPQARPLDNDVRSLVSARLKAGVKPAYIREADGWDYTNQQMYRMKRIFVCLVPTSMGDTLPTLKDGIRIWLNFFIQIVYVHYNFRTCIERWMELVGSVSSMSSRDLE